MIEFVFPQSTGEWLAWLVALGCMLIGLFLILAPRSFMRIVGLGASTDNSGGVSEVRGIVGGLFFGFGLACILFAQPLVYAALGLAFASAVIGRIISFVADRAFGIVAITATIVELCAAVFTLGYAFGMIP